MSCQRTCFLTRTKANQKDLVRFCLKDSILTIDKNYNLGGRGIYLLPSLEVFNRAILKNIFKIALKQNVNLSKELIDSLTKEFVSVINKT